MQRTRTHARASRLVAAMTVAALLLVACGSDDGGGDAGDEPAADSGSEGSASGSIDWWGWTPEAAIADEYISAFNEAYPDVEVTFRQIPIDSYEATLRPALASGAGPDVFNIAPGAQFVQFNELAIDMEDATVAALGEDWEEQLAPIGVAGLTNDEGTLKAISVGSTFAGPVWINQALFDEHGLEPPTTLDEWVDTCEEFRANDVGCFVHGASQVAFNQDAIQALADTINPGLFTRATIGEDRWDHPDLVAAFEAWGRLFEDGIMQRGALGLQQYPDANNAFMAQDYAMVMMGTWYMQFTRPENMIPAIEAAGVSNPEPFTAVPIPFPAVTDAGTPGALFGDSNYGLAVSANASNEEAALAFATWLGTSQEGQETVANALNDIPALVGLEPEWDQIDLVDEELVQPRLVDLIEWSAEVEDNRLLPNSELAQAIGEASTTIAAGDVSPEQAVETLQQAAEASGVEFD